MNLRIVVHGACSANQALRKAVERLRGEGHDVSVRVTWEAGDARRFAAQVAGDVDAVVAAGGDGTVSEVAAGLAERGGEEGAALAVVPLGTANDFADSLGIAREDVGAALDLALDPDLYRPIDLIHCDDRAVVNMATGGFGAQVTAETPEGLKRALGSLSYFVSGVSRLPWAEPHPGTVRGADFEWSGDFLAVAVGNGRQAGAGIELCPGALIDDGLMDVRVVPESGGTGRLLLEALLRDGRAVLEEASFAHRTPWLEIETEKPLHVNLDGEPMQDTRFRFEIEPGALTCAMPEGTPLVST